MTDDGTSAAGTARERVEQAIEELARMLARARRRNEMPDMGGAHNPLPTETQQARRFVEDLLAESEKEQERLREALERIAEAQPKVLAYIKREGFIFATPLHESKGWEKLAFSIYSDLCEVDSIARQALSPDSQEKRG